MNKSNGYDRQLANDNEKSQENVSNLMRWETSFFRESFENNTNFRSKIEVFLRKSTQHQLHSVYIIQMF